MKYSYAKEKLGIAYYELAIGEGDVRERIQDAFLIFHNLSEKDFPKELKDEWGNIYYNLTKKGPIYDYNNNVTVSSIKNTVRGIRKSTGKKLAIRIVKLYKNLYDY